MAHRYDLVKFGKDGPDASEDIFSRFTPLKAWRRRLVAPLFRISDTGWFGLTPLRTHILVCGYRRSGTTMLLAMLEHAYPKAKHFRKETSGWRAATWCWRNHEVMISKQPSDILVLHQVQKFYRGRKAKLRVIVCVRDPRDSMTSHRPERGIPYCVEEEKLLVDQDHISWHLKHSEVLLVRYEELTADPDAVQKKIEAFVGEKSEHPFSEFNKSTTTSNFDTAPLNGLRPVDRKGVGRWRDPKHKDRIEQILKEMPDLPRILVELGYEPNDSWIEAWRREVSGKSNAA